MPLIVIVTLGYFTGCIGPITDKRLYSNEYQYQVELKCVGPHNDTGSENHERTFRPTEWFYSRELNIYAD
jgi:hypothetical protein